MMTEILGRKSHFYHHCWCGICGGYTVHDSGICTRCNSQPRPESSTDKSVPNVPKPIEVPQQGEGSD